MSEFIFKNTEKLGNNGYMTFIDGERLLHYWEKEQIAYIPEIQRGLKTITNEQGESVEVPVFSQANVNKIKDIMLKESYYVSQITLNLLKKDSKLKYNEETRELKITKGVLAILDGQHRLRALKQLKEENSEFDLSTIIFPVKITNYEEEKAQEQFYQFTLGSKISSSRGEYFNNKDYSNKIVKDLFKNSILSDKIETVKNIISRQESNKIVSFATLKNSIQINFNTNKIDNDKESTEIYNFLKEFFEQLFITIPEFENYEDRLQLKEQQSLKCENFAFYGYLAIAEYLEDKENWKELLTKVNEIDFSKNSPLWASQVTKKNVIKRKSKNNKQQEVKYTIINNSQSRREMGVIMLKAFKKILRKNTNE